MPHSLSASRRAWLWPLVVAGLIFAASSRSHVAAPSVANFDKLAHFSLYGLLGTLVVRLGHGRRVAWMAVLVVSAYGLTDEWHQSFTPGRAVELADWLADTLGAALAIMLYTRWGWYRARLEAPVLGKARIENPPPIATNSAA